MTAERLPWNLEAEAGVLGSLLIDPAAIALVADILLPADFYRDAHQILYEVMLQLWKRHEPSDFITVCDELERQHKLETTGGRNYITSLINDVPTSRNIEYYGRIVAQKALYRRLIHAAGQIAAAAFEEEADALEKAETLLLSLRQQQSAGLATIRTILTSCMTTLDSIHSLQGSDSIIGIPTGFTHLNTVLGGWQRSDLVVLAARPGIGKTSFALNIAAYAAYHCGRQVAMFSLEMSKEQLGIRLLSMKTGIDQQRLRMGWIQDDEWERLIVAMEELSTDTLWIDDTAGQSLAAIRSQALRLQATQGVDLIIVDYLQLMKATMEGKRYGNREQEIAEISRGLKSIAKELNVPVLALAQLSRAVEGRAAKIPQLSDLRESGAIENDADVVLFLYREELYYPENEDARNTADIIIAKHRNGPVGTIRLHFDARLTRFEDLDIPSTKEDN